MKYFNQVKRVARTFIFYILVASQTWAAFDVDGRYIHPYLSVLESELLGGIKALFSISSDMLA